MVYLKYDISKRWATNGSSERQAKIQHLDSQEEDCGILADRHWAEHFSVTRAAVQTKFRSFLLSFTLLYLIVPYFLLAWG
jgi:hypothetical protein